MMWVVSVWCVLMVVCVSPGCMSQRDVTPELLEEIMPHILNTYVNRRIQGQFSLAISVPWNRGTYDLQAVFRADPADGVDSKVNGDGVYAGTYVVAAKVLERAGTGSQHSEFRVFAAKCPNQNVNAVQSLRGRDLLIFYTLNSPCSTTCTVPWHLEGILDRITVMTQWDQYAVVFTQAFVPRGAVNQTPKQVKDAENSRKGALSRLAGSLGTNKSPGITHIYRCVPGECFSCRGRQNAVLHRCVTLDGAAPPVIRAPSPGRADEDGFMTVNRQRG